MSMLTPKPRDSIMAAFDALPAVLRRALARADFGYDPEWVAERLKRGRRAKRLADAINVRTERRGA